MPPYLIRGTYKEVFTAFGSDFVLGGGTNISTLEPDFERSTFMGTLEECLLHLQTWKDSEKSDHEFYTQGNMFGAVLKMLFGANVYEHPLKKAEEDPENFANNKLASIDFGFVDKDGQLAAFHLEYRKDDPGQWLAGIIKNTNKKPEEREVLFMSSFEPKVVNSAANIHVSSVEAGAAPLIGTEDAPIIHNPLVRNILQAIFLRNGKVHPDSDIIEQFTQLASDRGGYEENRELLDSLQANVDKALANPGLKAIKELGLVGYRSVASMQKCLRKENPFYQQLAALTKLSNKTLATQRGVLLLFLDSTNLSHLYSGYSTAAFLPALSSYIKENMLGKTADEIRENCNQVKTLWSSLDKSLSSSTKETIIAAFLRSSKSSLIQNCLHSIRNDSEAKVILNRLRDGENDLQFYLDKMHGCYYLPSVLASQPTTMERDQFYSIADDQELHQAIHLLQKNGIETYTELLLEPAQFERLKPFISELSSPDQDKIAKVSIMLWLSNQGQFDHFYANQNNIDYLRLLKRMVEINALKGKDLADHLQKTQVFLEEIKPKILETGPRNEKAMASLAQCYLVYPGDNPLAVLPRLKNEPQIRLLQFLLRHETQEANLISLVDQLQVYPQLAEQLMRLFDKGIGAADIMAIGIDPEKHQLMSLFQDHSVPYTANDIQNLLLPFSAELQTAVQAEPNAEMRKCFLQAAVNLARNNLLSHELLKPEAQLQRQLIANLQRAVPGNLRYSSLAVGSDVKSHDFKVLLREIFSNKLPPSGQKLLIEEAFTAITASTLDNLQPDTDAKKKLAKPLSQMHVQMTTLKHLESLQLEQKTLDLLKGQDATSQKFFRIAMFIEEQCEQMRKRLEKNNPQKYQKMLSHEADYRKALYGILHDSLTGDASPRTREELNKRLEKAEKPLLDALEGDSRKAYRQGMRIIANFFSILLIGIPNLIHHRHTGNWTFFSTPRSRETAQTVSKKVRDEIESSSENTQNKM
ncbi:hypothetical protein B1207_04310 [Legionella quinlivanii]|uniref:Uncharacterized protein n=1 Tax=Legionella quinlivanii TaxID=45073 RepID=A0A364LL01_9GAMM|nr:hypothetical protein [Legionella quinlivanii]RAP37404.1 hypothetical protein B1207_04310 [Legionella quinlivanii]